MSVCVPDGPSRAEAARATGIGASNPVEAITSPVASPRVSLSPYVNEPLPNWEELLSAHDVARLTRRPRWVVLSLALLGRFPRKHRYHGRNIGWLRSDVVTWLARDLRVLRCHTSLAVNARSHNARAMGIIASGLHVDGHLYGLRAAFAAASYSALALARIARDLRWLRISMNSLRRPSCAGEPVGRNIGT